MKTFLAAMAMGVVLAACSAGGKDPTKSTTPPTTTPTASDLIVSLNKTSINSTGADTATLTVTAVDANRNAVAAIPVTVTPDSGAIYTTSSNSTNAAGSVTGTIGTGNDHSNRTVTVVIQSGSIKKSVSLGVQGATLTATAGTGNAGSASTIQYTLLDAASIAIADASVTVSVAGQADVNGKTDAAGKYSFPFTMPSTATNVTATAAGVTVTSTVTPTNGSTIIPDAAAVTSPSLSANPSSVSTGHTVELRALFIGANNAPIPNVRARFQMVDSNSIGGSLSSDASDGTHNVVYSDGNGVARTTYAAGTRGGVITPKVCWDVTDFASGACPNAVTASSLTVVASGVSVAVLTNGQIIPDDVKNIYAISYVVQVVDASNQPISGSLVTGAVDIPRFYRGQYAVSAGKWSPGLYTDNTLTTPIRPARQSCDNEDVNRNNVLENGEDMNASGTLEPFKASVTIAPTSANSNVTDSFGKAYFTMQYGQNYASWEDVILTFTTTVEGTEGHATYASDLPVPVTVLGAPGDPPFKTSPYNEMLDGLPSPWVVSRTSVTNPGVIYPATANFNLCSPQQ